MAEHISRSEAGEPRAATDEAFSVEAHGINTIPLEDRHGTARELFFVWAGANTNYIYLILGSLVVSFGLGFWPAVVAIVVAHSFYLLLGAAAVPGPKAGTATMVVSRSAFGVRGNRPYAFLSWLTTVGWEAVFIVVATLALVQLAGLAHLNGLWVKIASLVVIAAVTFIVAIFGHATIVWMQRILTYALGIGMVVLAILVLPKGHLGGFHVHAGAAGTPAATWILAVEVLVAGVGDVVDELSGRLRALSQAVRVIQGGLVLDGIRSDHSRGRDQRRRRRRRHRGEHDRPGRRPANLVPTWFFAVFLLIVIAGAVANNFLNTYSSGMSLLALGARVSRHTAVVVDGVLATLMAIYALFVSNFVGSFQNFLALMVLWIAPWGRRVPRRHPGSPQQL